MSLKTVIGFVITILSVILLIPGCTSSSQKNISSIKHGTTLSGSGGKIYKTYILNTPLGPINEEVIRNAKENVQTLFEKLKNETDETQKKLIRQELAFAKMNYDELLPIPFKSQLPQTGKGVTVAVIDSGISSKTIQHLESKFIDYYEMAPDYSIEKKNKAKLHPFKLFSIIDSHIIEIVSQHGDDMVRFINRTAPDAGIMCINNYNREYQVRLGGSRFSKRFYDAPVGITKSIEYLLVGNKLSKPMIINISEGVSHFRRNLNKKSVIDLKQAFKKAYEHGIIIVISAGNMTNKAEDSYKLGLNPGLDCPWVIPAGAVDPENNSRKTRYDPTNRYKVLYVPARSSSVAAAKVSGLIALLLEKNPSMTPYQIKKISLETADYHEEENGRKVYSINITKAMKSIK